MAHDGGIVPTTQDERIDQLWSVHEIRQLAYSYAYAVDTRDWDLMFSLWVDRAPVAYPTLDLHRMKELTKHFGVEAGPSTLFVGNHRIHFDGRDKAHGQVYCLVFSEWKNFYEQAVCYHDVYERENGKWLFVKRDHLLWWGEVRATNPMAQPDAKWPASEVGAGDAFQIMRKKK